LWDQIPIKGALFQMAEERPQNEIMGGGQRPANAGGLRPEEQRVLDLALAAFAAANRTSTEEVTVRNRAVVASEIREAFATHDKLTTGRKVVIALGVAASFGLGLLVRGWVTNKDYDDEDEENSVHE
jgi:hypothetical protein